MSADTSEPAFPLVESPSGQFPAHTGMTLRDYFAAKAMQGILAGPCSRDGVGMSEWFDMPAFAYSLADAMINARSA